MCATGPPFFRKARPSVSHLVDSARPRSTSPRFADPLEDEKDQEDDRQKRSFPNCSNATMVHRDLIDLAGLQALRAVSDRSGPINNVHMEDDEGVHDEGNNREWENEDDIERYGPVEDHNET